MMMMMYIADLIIFFAYISIPIQILIALVKYPRIGSMPNSVCFLLILFALFIFLCGTGHLLRCLQLNETRSFYILNICTAIVSVATTIYLLPLVPAALTRLDDLLNKEIIQLTSEKIESKQKLVTFMAFLCHEIRNPLFAITSSATNLQEDTVLSPSQETAVGSIMDSALLMLRLVNDVLDLSKISSGKLELEPKVFNLPQLIQRIHHTLELQVQQDIKRNKKCINLQVTVQEPIPKLICTDEVRLLQIIYNLTSNSIKFTNQGSITVDLSILDDDKEYNNMVKKLQLLCNKKGNEKYNTDNTDIVDNDDCQDDNKQIDLQKIPLTMEEHNHSNDDFSMSLLDSAEQGANNNDQQQEPRRLLKLTVTDSGCGIDPDRLAMIFEPYTQAKLSDYRIHGGTGLGLSIVSGLLKIMGGHIEATSKLNEGSTFVVYLPVQVIEDGSVQDNNNSAFDNSIDRNDDEQSVCTDGRIGYTKRLHDSVFTAGTTGTSFSDDSHQSNYYDEEHHDATSGDHNTTMIQRIESISQHSHTTEDCSSSLFEVEQIHEETKSFNNVPLSSSSLPLPQNKKKKVPLVKFHLPDNEFVVLIVDDNHVNQKIIARMLNHFGLQCQIANNGQEAVDTILLNSRNYQPHNTKLPIFGLILMDLSMPVLDGFGAIQKLRQNHCTLPIIALTANALNQERDRALQMGATGFQTKPILRDGLYDLCKKYIDESSMKENQQQQQQETNFT